MNSKDRARLDAIEDEVCKLHEEATDILCRTVSLEPIRPRAQKDAMIAAIENRLKIACDGIHKELEILRKQHECVVCGATLLPNTEAPHCMDTCVPTDEDQADYEAAIERYRQNCLQFSNLERIAAQYGATLSYDNGWDKDRCASSGKQIWYGDYDDEELLTISIFHELGHVRHSTYSMGYMSKFEEEAAAWFDGLQLAAKHGIMFSPEALHWAHRQLCTYFYLETREMGPNFEEWVKTHQTIDSIKQAFEAGYAQARTRLPI